LETFLNTLLLELNHKLTREVEWLRSKPGRERELVQGVGGGSEVGLKWFSGIEIVASAGAPD